MPIIRIELIMTPPGEGPSGPGLSRGAGPPIKESISMPQPIALKLRALREERGLTQKEAAELADVSHWTVLLLESGKRAPYMPTVTKLARAYGVTLEELVGEEE
jgi:DNA-binding XRE family transcriptional regulator